MVDGNFLFSLSNPPAGKHRSRITKRESTTVVWISHGDGWRLMMMMMLRWRRSITIWEGKNMIWWKLQWGDDAWQLFQTIFVINFSLFCLFFILIFFRNFFHHSLPSMLLLLLETFSQESHLWIRYFYCHCGYYCHYHQIAWVWGFRTSQPASIIDYRIEWKSTRWQLCNE